KFPFRVMRKSHRVELITVFMEVHPNVVSSSFAFSNQLGTVIQPSGIDADFLFRVLLFEIPEECRVMIVDGINTVVPYVVLVCPCTCNEMCIAYCRNGGRLGIPVFLSTGV